MCFCNFHVVVAVPIDFYRLYDTRMLPFLVILAFYFKNDVLLDDRLSMEMDLLPGRVLFDREKLTNHWIFGLCPSCAVLNKYCLTDMLRATHHLQGYL